MSRFRHMKQNSIVEIVSTMASFLVAGVGLERPTRVACRFWHQTQFGTKHSLAPKASRFGSTASRKATLWLSCGADPLPPVALRREVLLKFRSQLCKQKEKVAQCATFSFWLRGWDFEHPRFARGKLRRAQ